MKASQITTRNLKGVKIVRSLAAVAVLTFFVAGPTEAKCNKSRRVRRPVTRINTQDTHSQSVRDVKDIPRIEVLRDGHHNPEAPARGYGWDGRQTDLRGITPMYGNTTIPINDTARQRRKEEERILRERIIRELKANGVIRDRTQTSTTTQPGNGTGTTTTKPQPKPTPKPKPKQPKVTKLPNGDQITEYPDGRREIKMKNGDTVTTHKNGKRVIKKSNGSTTETHPSGYKKTTDRYGNGKAKFPDGTVIDYKSSGEATLTTKSGEKYHREPGKGFKKVD